MFTKKLPARFEVDAAGHSYEGHASAFNVQDSYGDIILPGAFKKTIHDRVPKGLMKGLWMHQYPMGIVREAEEDEVGLHVLVEIADTAENLERLRYMQPLSKGYAPVDRLSIGWDLVEGKYEPNPAHKAGTGLLLRECIVFEVSPVNVAANESAMVAFVKALEPLLPATDDVRRVLARYIPGHKAAVGRTQAQHAEEADPEAVSALTRSMADAVEALAKDQALIEAQPRLVRVAVESLQALMELKAPEPGPVPTPDDAPGAAEQGTLLDPAIQTLQSSAANLRMLRERLIA